MLGEELREMPFKILSGELWDKKLLDFGPQIVP
jgi:hypothetical protein